VFNEIGFGKHKDKVKEVKDEPADGSIKRPTPPEKNPRVWVKLENGRFKDYTIGGLNNVIKGSKKERAEQLKIYLIKLQNFKK
jgi:hypothetical protein